MKKKEGVCPRLDVQNGALDGGLCVGGFGFHLLADSWRSNSSETNRTRGVWETVVGRESANSWRGGGGGRSKGRGGQTVGGRRRGMGGWGDEEDERVATALYKSVQLHTRGGTARSQVTTPQEMLDDRFLALGGTGLILQGFATPPPPPRRWGRPTTSFMSHPSVP